MSIFTSKSEMWKDIMMREISNCIELDNGISVTSLIELTDRGQIDFHIKAGTCMRVFSLYISKELPDGWRLGNIYTDYNCHKITLYLPHNLKSTDRYIPLDIIKNKPTPYRTINEFRLILSLTDIKDIDLTHCRIRSISCETPYRRNDLYNVHINPDIEMDSLSVSDRVGMIDYKAGTSPYKIGTLYLNKRTAASIIKERELLKVNFDKVNII